MKQLGIIVPATILVAIVILVTTIYQHVKAATLSLPISPVLTALVIVLPFVAVVNAIHLQRSLLRHTSETPFWSIVEPLILQALQGIFTVVLATLLATNFVPSPIMECVLEKAWQRLYSSHDGEAIRRIQEALNCCGFNSLADRQWPFPHNGRPAISCAATNSRTLACRVPLTQALQQYSGVDFGAVVAVALFQIASIFLLRSGFSWRSSTSWLRSTNRLTNGEEPHGSRGLLNVGGDVHTDDGEDEAQRDSQTYFQDRPSHEQGPRLEPSTLTQQPNEWQ